MRSLSTPPFVTEIINATDNQYQASQQAKNRLSSLLSQEAEYLLQKKQRNIIKQQRVKQLEQQYETERKIKLQKLQTKISNSQKVRQRNQKDITEKMKRQEEKFQDVVRKLTNQNVEQINKKMAERHKYQSQESKTAKNFHPSIRLLNDRRKSEMQNSYFSINPDLQIQKINEKLHKAQMNNQIFKKIRSQKAKNQLQVVLQKKNRVKMNKTQIQSQIYRNFYDKANSIYSSLGKSKIDTDKQIQDRKKVLEEKMRKCQENLKNLQQRKQQKLQQIIKQKMDKRYTPKTWKNEKAEFYHQKFIQNSKKLEQQQYEKSEEILKKHMDISFQNKVYKQKKQQIYQAIMLS